MPRDFTDCGNPILTEEEFVEFAMNTRGYEMNDMGNWELVHPEMAITSKTKNPASRITKSTSNKNTSNFSKDFVLEKISNYLSENNFKFEEGKVNLLVTNGSDIYELKATRKTTSFIFNKDFNGTKDVGKNKFITLLSSLTFCQIGVIDDKGTVGFTNGIEYITIGITKKRK